MNESTFQLDRFSELVKQTLRNKKELFVISLMIVAAFPLLLLFINKFLKEDMYEGLTIYKQALFYRNVFAAFAILAPFLFFFNINQSMKGIVAPMLLHTSALEKFLNMVLICFVLVPLSVAIVYGLSHNLFATIFPQYLYQLKLIDLQNLFIGRLFTPALILLMQVSFFLNLLYGEKKVRKTILTCGVLVFLYLLLIMFTDIFNMGVPVSLLVLERFSSFLFVLLLYVLPVVLFISSYLMLIKKEYPTRIDFVTGVQAE